jgi:hypothetical protein
MNRSDAIILINRESGFGPYEVTGMGLLGATNLSADFTMTLGLKDSSLTARLGPRYAVVSSGGGLRTAG